MSTDLLKQVKIAYKKLKSYAYFDKNAFFLKRRIAEFENNTNNLDEYFETITRKLILRKELCDCPERPIMLPKSLVTEDCGSFVTNLPKTPEILKIQYFADTRIDEAIISVLWVIRVGSKIDQLLSENCYGNRVQNKTVDTWSPYLFKPFPHQYSAWRDLGIQEASECIDKEKDCIVITSDFSSFYYNLHLTESVKNRIFELIDKNTKDSSFDYYLTS